MKKYICRPAFLMLLSSMMGLTTLMAPQPLKAQTSAQQQPNIIFILTDDQGYGDVGVFFQKQRAKDGKPYQRSPYLDQLAQSGAILTQQYSAAPVCAPSRASLMLGVSQGHANVRDNEFDRAIDSNYTMASTLKTLGYNTVAIGKWGLQGHTPWDKDGDAWNARPTNRGFEQFFGYMRHIDGHEHYPKESLYFKDHQPIEVWDQGKDITPELDKCYTADLWTAYAKKWIIQHQQSAQKEKPFFMYLAFETPHAVLELPTQAYPGGQGLKGGLQWLGTPGHMINTASGVPDSYIHPDYATATYDDDDNPATKEVPWPDTYKRYAMSNRRIDDCVGDLMALLKDLDIADNTLVIFTSDNGPSIEDYLPKGYTPVKPTFFASYGPFDGIKRDNWEGGIRMPVIAAWPGHIPAGKIITQPSISYDWAPTFIQAAGAVAPQRMDGVSLLTELTGQSEDAKLVNGTNGSGPQDNPKQKAQLQQGVIYNEYYFPGKTPAFNAFAPDHRGRVRNQMQFMRLDSFVAVRYNIKAATDDFELYNVVTDPGQRNNLAQSPNLKVHINMPESKSRYRRTDRGTALEKSIQTIADLQAYFKQRVLQVRRPEKWAKRPYDSALVPPTYPLSIIKKKGFEQGVNWQYFDGNFPWLPQTRLLSPAQKGQSYKADLSPDHLKGFRYKKGNASGIMDIEGLVHIAQDGAYTFYLRSGTHAFLRLHEAQLIDADFGYTTGTEKSATIFLTAGLHSMHLIYKINQDQRANNKADLLQLDWSGPGFAREPLKASDIWHEDD